MTNETLFLNPAKAAQMLFDGGIPESEICSILVPLKGTEFTVQYDGTTFFDPRELQRIINNRH